MNHNPEWMDLRSDTVTQPTEEMRSAMAHAAVGDDVYQDDPTVIELESLAADLLGMEAALFVPSGVFGNQLCVCTHTQRGQEVLIPESNHIFFHETGAMAVISGVQTRTIPEIRGCMDLDRLKESIRDEDIHNPPTGLICVENAHSCGAVVPLEHLRQVYEIAQEAHIPVHLDGARIFNAAISLRVEAHQIAQYADSVMFCLSKGLCAPVGSMIAGTEAFIHKARRNRKMMGGALRQVGVLAAAGLVGLHRMVERLEQDHRNARKLADLLAGLDGVEVQKDRLDINMVFFRVQLPDFDPDDFVNHLMQQRIKINGLMQVGRHKEFRLVTHHGITEEGIEKAFEAIRFYWDSHV